MSGYRHAAAATCLAERYELKRKSGHGCLRATNDSKRKSGYTCGYRPLIPAFVSLTDVKIRQTKASDKPRKLADGNGLYLEVRPNGSKLWRYRYRIVGKENVFAIGAYPGVSLLDARRARDEARDLVEADGLP